MHKSIFSTIFFLFITTVIFSQKKPLDHSVYDGWKSLSDINISNDGKIVSVLISPQEGDTALFLKNTNNNLTRTFDRVRSYKLSTDGRWTVGLLKAPFAERRQARIDKKKKGDMPQDSLLIIDNLTFRSEKIPGIKSYKTAADMAVHVAYTIDLPKDTTDKKDAKEKEILIVRNLLTQQEDTFRNAKEHTFNRYDNSFVVSIKPDKNDSTDSPRVEFIDLDNNIRKVISNEEVEYKSFTFDEPGRQLVYIATGDTSKTDQKTYDLRYYKSGQDSSIVISEKTISGMPEGWIFNEYASPGFSKDGRRILIGALPKQEPKDTTIVDFEMAELDIWHWQDPIIQPQQLVEKRRRERETYTGIIYTDNLNQFIPLANEKMPSVTVSDEGNGRYALITSNLPYLIESQWDLSPKYDVWMMDLTDNSLHEVTKELNGRPILSPQGNYIYWWDATIRDWFSYDNTSNSLVNLTERIPVNFWDERNDVPHDPGSYGIAAWGENDEYVFVYDMFDIWKIDPDGDKKPVNITQNTGRNDSLTFRYINTDPDKRFVGVDDELLLSAFDNVSKETGYYTLKQKGRNPLKKRVMDGFTFSREIKAKDEDIFVYQKSNFNTSPDLYITRDYWNRNEKLTDINPQMNDYNWGTAELFSWTSYAGIPLQGIVYKPEDFDPAKKYPVMIYFYEKHSDNLYSYFTPAPSRSTVNIPFFVSRGYIVFTPDIHYTVGQPGMDSYNAVVSGAEAIAKNSWVDAENMAIQGQSWGGYQVAYIVTQTDMFKAAGAGAPVSNMTSAYGGIRWESGRSRQYQYEQTQSRIGAPMNDSLHLYIENSPLFYTENIKTPLLIMHNDEDGAVPWYQGIELFMSMRRLGKPVWMLQYNNEAHNLIHRRNTKDLSIRLQQFFDHYLKGEPAPVWMTRGLPATEKGKTWGYDIE
ncbi:MAG: prolyl oligopeptidase family serine peptidase [Fermentimonas sp.]|nr:prolyl oligopeptidase family serine peptidase [Fermentimonas sp.]